MKKFLLWALFLLLPFFYSVYVSAQPGKERDCSTTCFSSEVVSVKRLSDTCSAYELQVSWSGDCAHALSHFTVAVPCGAISDLWNSENWAQSIGTDPTTGLKGFKIDNIPNFGEDALTTFTVKFTVCSDGEQCAGELSCWQPLVAYKAATCVNYESLSVSCASLKADISKTDVTCFGADDGTLSVVVEEGVEPYTFTWSDGITDGARTGVAAGQYSVVVRDASGSEVSLDATVGQPEALVLSGTSTPAACNGTADGSIDLAVSGGIAPYTFSWSNGVTTEDLTALASGQYNVTVTDASGCQSTARFSVGVTSSIDLSAVMQKPDCNDDNGSLDITVTGGSAPYTFSWSGGETTEDLADVGAGLYTVTVTDVSGCTQSATYFLKEENSLSLQGTGTASDCSDATGAIDLTITGGTAPFTIEWSNGETTEDLSGLASGSYTVTVTDSKGCTATRNFNIPRITFQVPKTIEKPSCYGGTDGSITLGEPSGGTPPYTYEWSNGETGSALTGLDAGMYTVTVTDATGCSRTLSFAVTDPTPINAQATVSNLECNTEGKYNIDLTVSGGTAPYSYTWSNGATVEDPANLETGSYSVVITDANGCQVTKEILVEGTPASWACLITALTDNPGCQTNNNLISTTIVDADSYTWTVQSTDGLWSVVAANAPSTTFTSGGENSSAVFTLTIVKDGCTQTCTYQISACTTDDGGNPDNDDPDGDDPDDGDPGTENPYPGTGDDGDQSCSECFETTARIIDETATCRTYEMVVSTNGLCRHDLSHWTLAIPCGTVSNYWNSEGWKMVFGQDPPTGLYGLKVDDINTFGKEADSFTVRFTICESNGCDLSAWSPVVAYKAGLCVATETLDAGSLTNAPEVSVYPNPFNEVVHFEWSATTQQADLEVIDQYGNVVAHCTEAVEKPEGYGIDLESFTLPKGMYYFRLTAGGKTYSGKISKK